MSYPQTLAIITYITLTASNYIVVDQFEPLINEYRCDPHQSCTISCLSTVSCAGSTLYCPVDHDCNIICDPRNNDGANACFNTIIHAETSKSLSVTVTAYESNAELMTIYTPYPEINDGTKSVLTCYSGASNLNQCKDIQIYAIRGFDDIELKCNDGTSLCDISGSMKCGYNQYNHDECQSFQYTFNQIGYQCLTDTFCSDNTAMPTTNNPSISPTKSPIKPSTINPTKSPSKSPTPSPTNPESSIQAPLIPKIPSTSNNTSGSSTMSPTAIPTVSVVKKGVITMSSSSKQDAEIHSLYVVIAGTLTISCFIFLTLTICGIIYIRLNRENVEEKIIKRYIAGRGLSISLQRIKKKEDAESNNSNDISSNNDTSTSNPNASNLSSSIYITDNGSEDSNGLGLTTTYPMGGDTANRMEMEMKMDDDDEYDEFDDELDDIVTSGDDVDDINIINHGSTIQCIASQSSHSGVMYGELKQSVSHRNTKTFKPKLNMNINNNKYEIEMAQIQNDRTIAIAAAMQHKSTNDISNDDEIRDGYVDNIITTNSAENTSLQIDNDHSINTDEQTYYFTESDDTENNGDDEAKEEEEDEYMATNTLPPPPPKLYQLHNTNHNDTDHLTEKQKEILLENIRNKARCFGYSQPEILYEEDEDFTDDDSDESDDDSVDKTKKLDININNKYSNHLKVGQENNENCSDTDDLLEEGEIISTHHDDIGIEIKIDLINNNDKENILTPSTEMDDPEILSDDEELPTLPNNNNNNNNHSQYRSIINNGHNLSVDNIAYPPTMSFE